MTGRPRHKPAAAGVSWDDVRRAALALPDASAATSYGTPSVKVGSRFFLRLKEDGASVALRVGSMEERDFLLAADPAVFFITAHYRDYPAVLFRLATITRGALGEVLEQAWQGVTGGLPGSPKGRSVKDDRRAGGGRRPGRATRRR